MKQIFSIILVLCVLGCDEEKGIQLKVSTHSINDDPGLVFLELQNAPDSIFLLGTDIVFNIYGIKKTEREYLSPWSFIPNPDDRNRWAKIEEYVVEKSAGRMDKEEIIRVRDSVIRYNNINVYDPELFPVQIALESIMLIRPKQGLYLTYVDLGDFAQYEEYDKLAIQFAYYPSGLDQSGLEYQFILPEEIAGYRYYSDTIPMRELEVDLPVLR